MSVALRREPAEHRGGIDKLRVLHVSQPVGVGVPGYVAELVADQFAHGWEVAVASPPEERPLREAVQATGARYFEWRASRNPGSSTPREIAELRTVVDSFRPDVVHLHSSMAGLAARLLLRGRIPTLFQPHSWSFLALSGTLGWAAETWERLGARWADEVICVSEWERDRGEQAGIRARWRVIKNGVDLDAFPEATADHRRFARARLGLDPDAPLAVCVARLCRQKGQDLLVEAWPAVRSAIPDARLYLVGDGPDRERLLHASGEGVRLMGHRDDVSDWLAASDVVALPSRWEGMSLAMLEAMACGRSIVATDVGGARETIGTAAGAVVDANSSALAAALVRRLGIRDLARIEGLRARRIVQQEHDARASRYRVRTAYADVLARRRSEEIASPAAAR